MFQDSVVQYIPESISPKLVEWKGRVGNRLPRFKDKVLCGDAEVLMDLVIYSKMRMKINRAKRVHEGI